MSKHPLLIRASAGSGKTYQLAVRFLALLAVDRRPERILALTFTRKAAGEFAERIFYRLAEAAADDGQALALGAEIRDAVLGTTARPGLAPGWPGPLPAARAEFGALLALLVKALDRLAMGTYDSFFVRIGRVHACELGLGTFHLLEDAEAEEEQERVFRRIFSRLTSTARERADFLRAFQEATAGRAEVRLTEALAEFIDDHHQRFLACPDEQAWGSPERLWPDGDPWPVVADWSAFADGLGKAIPPEWWGRQDAGKSWQNALDWIVGYWAGKPSVPAVVTNVIKVARALLDNGEGNVTNRVSKTVSGAEARWFGELGGGLVGAEIRQRLGLTRGIWRLIDLYERQYADAVRRQGRVGFSDLTLLLSQAGLGREGVGQTIGFRLDQQFDHWMLDEFQDTNRPQWEAVHGLLQEIQQDPDGERTFFVVGDAKQSVHQWRGAEPRLFDEIAADPGWRERMVEWAMDVSHRSAQPVLAMVNRVCDPEQPWMRTRFPVAALERWVFHRHEASARHQTLAGCAQVIEYQAGAGGEEDGEAVRPEFAWLAALVAGIQPVERGLTCGVLVPTNKEAAEAGDFLRASGHKVEIEGEAEAGKDSPAAATVLDFFRWLHAPGDRLAWGHVRASPLHGVLESLFGEADGGAPCEPALWSAARRDLAVGGYVGLVGRLVGALEQGVCVDEFNRQRLHAWVREAARFDERGGAPGDFVRWMLHWKEREHSRAGAVQVMTVHKAKGLQFDVVILPGLKESPHSIFDNTGNFEVIEDQDRGGRSRLVMLAPNKDVVEADQTLSRLCDDWKARQCYEHFCQLYVAMTRAVRGLYLLVPEAMAPRVGAGPRRTFAAWVGEAARSAGAPRETMMGGLAGRILHETGQADWYLAHPVAPDVEPPPAVPARLPPIQDRRKRSTPSGRKSTATGKITNAASDRQGAMGFGSAVHAAFEAIAWLDEGVAPPMPADPEVRQVVERCLAGAAFRELLRHPGGEVELLREQPFDRITDGEWTSGVIDRAHVVRAGGRRVAATIIDYKTDAVKAAADLVGPYRPQMVAYREALAAILDLKPDAIRCLLASTKVGEVVEV